MATKVKVCPCCETWTTTDTKTCPTCHAELITTDYTDIFFGKISPEVQKQYISDVLKEKVSPYNTLEEIFIDKNFLLTTGNNFEGYRIVEYLRIVSGETFWVQDF